MIGGVGQLGNLKILRPLFFTAIDRRIQVDEMPAGIPPSATKVRASSSLSLRGYGDSLKDCGAAL
jgi:hypothetical protein